MSSDCGNSSKSRNKIVRQKTDEDIKKLYGLRKVEHETKHLEIMIEMQRTTAPFVNKIKKRATSANQNNDSVSMQSSNAN